ncbi:DUF2391 family protein [Candidatus Halobonum tyrrellensis]|uniref:Integral membrane protein n=1 Tax=Candidatus Halobonum tyrrellensis G22 TaxID=1324957 RepID=V4IXV0_9EURY|nr:DUF2391 family protein [Candidatus Halobonum tyrrellensis]ESP87987.1 hypothetical protein K933_11751 [Candidatus Halobonum tyrrellensis G22]
MEEALADELREQGRGIVGALFVLGVTATYTQEIWWLGQSLSAEGVLAYSTAGVILVYLASQAIGFREGTEAHDRPYGLGELTDFAEVLLQGLLTSLVALWLLGMLSFGDSLTLIVRRTLFLTVPYALGAAVADTLLSGGDDDPIVGDREDTRALAFVAGALFICFPIAPTQEVLVMANRMNWWRLFAIALVSLGTGYLTLYTVEFRGQDRRLGESTWRGRVGLTCTAYVFALATAALLLAGFGAFTETSHAMWVRQTVVLGFPASIGAAGAGVVLS